MLRIDSLTAGYGGFQVLDRLSLEVARGGVTALIGANGAGKTTLLKAIAGVIPSRGRVEFDGEDIASLPVAARVLRGLVLVPEGRELFPQMTVEENLALGGYRMTRDARRRGVAQVLEFFPVLAERRRQAAGTMSGGEQQMLAIARALVSKPRLMMLDEPSLGLAPKIVADLFRVVGAICAAGTSVLLVEQNVRQALHIAGHCYVLERGTIVAEGPGDRLIESELVRHAYLGTI
jgi:branched-chain amino acid transport system ATP-binding protein